MDSGSSSGSDSDYTITTEYDITRNIQLVSTVAISFFDQEETVDGARVTITDAVDYLQQTGAINTSTDSIALLFRGFEQDSDAVVCVNDHPMIVGEIISFDIDGRTNRHVRSVTAHHGTYQLSLPREALEAIGIDVSSESQSVSLWAGDGVIGIQRPVRQV